MRIRKLIAVALLAGAVAPVQAHDQTWVWPSGTPNFKPRFLGAVTKKCYQPTHAQDLLTAGLGKTGLGGAAPEFVDPLQPTPLELRRRAIYTNYRAVLDPTAAGGYGTLYGPNVDKERQRDGFGGLHLRV